MSDMVPEVLNAALDSLFTPKEPGELEYQGDDGLLYCRNCHTPVQCRVKLWGRDKSIAMLHNWLMLEAIREDHPKERIVMVILPGAGGELLTEDGSRDIFEDVYDEMEADLVADGELLLHYDKSDVIETDRTRYLLGATEVSEIDQNGSECSINLFTLERTIDYVNENLTVVSIGGELVPALRLI